ncbi:TetR/AcrR family transcriptional regulator [Roseovarius sp. Pro17]|uniref:TetR/AcrR family transcriptional regulator n=1 Tax=Roseovarius sp. Pro17 TaxID=3108175 RepID=UPI002D793CE5|nr:TetR/AcrR family transcriptional regulator [Roseovarius sp. Pro17]
MVQKKPGRPRKFERDVALNGAVEVFWAKGFEGASLDDLTHAMGINRPSLYATFGDKQALFLSALEQYGKGVGTDPLRAFDAATSAKAAVQAFLETALRNNTRSGSAAKGCLFACCAATVAEANPEVQAFLKNGMLSAEKHLEDGLERFKKRGDLPPTYPADAKARLMMDMMQGQAFRARAGESREKLLADLPARLGEIVPVK